MPDVTLIRRHKHAGKWREAGETIAVPAPVANWLSGLGVAEIITPARSSRKTSVVDTAADETETTQVADAAVANHIGE